MAQVLTQTPFEKQNYSQGGLRLLIRELDVPNKGYQYIGNIHTPDFAATLEFYEHFSAASGAEVKDNEAPNKTGYKLGFTADEMLIGNFKRFLFAGAPADVAADASAAGGPDTVIAGKTGDLFGLVYGRQTEGQRGDLVVRNVTDAADLVEDTDYEVLTIFGWTFIRLLVDTHNGDTLKIGTGAAAVDPYEHNQLAHKSLKPMTSLKLEVAAILQGPAKVGVNFEWRIPRAVIKPDGALDWNAKEASSFKFALELLDDSATDPAKPFGELLFYGRDNAGAALI